MMVGGIPGIAGRISLGLAEGDRDDTAQAVEERTAGQIVVALAEGGRGGLGQALEVRTAG